MKKKLFSALLSLAMVITMMPAMTMTAFGGTCNTIGDVLKTVAFPTSESWSTSPYDAWINENSGMTCYKTDTQFVFNGKNTVELNNPVTEEGENYKYEYKWDQKSLYTITFNMDNDILKNITIDSSNEDYIEAKGKYKARIESNWLFLAKAMAGEAQTTLDNVFTVSDDAQSGVRTITILTDITAGNTDSALCVPSGKKIVLDLNGHELNRGLVKDGIETKKTHGSVIEVRQDGELTINDKNTAGGGVLNGNSGAFAMEGGEITGNTAATYGGGVFAHNEGTHTFGGAAVVRENKSADTTDGIDESNVHLHYNEDSKAQAKVSISTEKPLSKGAEIGLTVYEGSSDTWGPGKSVEDFFADNALTENNMKYFFMNDCAEYTGDHDYQGVIYSIKKQDSDYVLSGAYKVEVNATENGTVTTDKSYYPDGEIVTLTVTPDEGYELKSLKYNDGTDHVITDEDSGYKFTMPKANVTVKAEFVKKSAPTPAPTPDKGVKTGDSNDIFFYGFTTLIALLGAGFVYGLRRKEER